MIYHDVRDHAILFGDCHGRTARESLSQNPFIDGNKRTAFAAMYTFLAINNLRLTADASAVYDFIATLYEEHMFQFATLVIWLRGHAESV